jgi:hypothetical protein
MGPESEGTEEGPRRRLLVLAGPTTLGDPLRDALVARAARSRLEVTLLLPAPRDDMHAAQDLRDAVERLRADGLDLAGRLGDEDAYAAVAATWDPRAHDELLVVTPPLGRSQWLAQDLPARLEQLTGTHVGLLIAAPG